MLRNSSMVANIKVKPRKKSLQKYEIGAQAKQEIKKLVEKSEIGSHHRQYYGGR